MEDLTQNWSCMYLSHRESHGCSLTKKADSISQSIVANILTKKAPNVDIITRTFNPLWRTCNGFQIQNLGNHIMLFTFDNKADVDCVLAS